MTDESTPIPTQAYIETDPQVLEINWQIQQTRLLDQIHTVPYLLRNYQKNQEEARKLVAALPLVHAERSISGQLLGKILGFKRAGAIIPRAQLTKDGQTLIDTNNWDQKTGLSHFVSLGLGNVASFTAYGQDVFVVDPKILMRELSFFVPASDTIMYDPQANSSRFLPPLQQSILPATRLTEWMSVVAAAFYETPISLLTEEATTTAHRLGLKGVPMGVYSFIQQNRGAGYSPEIRVRQVPINYLRGYTVAGGTSSAFAQDNIHNVLRHLPRTTIIKNLSPAWIQTGLVIHEWWKTKGS